MGRDKTKRAFPCQEIQITERLQLWNAAIYGILKYGLIAIKIGDQSHIKIQQFESKRILSIVEAGGGDRKMTIRTGKQAIR